VARDPGRALPVYLRPYPTSDRDFASVVSETVEAVVRTGPSTDDFEQLVERRLRDAYPNAVVRVQEPLAQLVDRFGTLYAYRDGRFQPDDPLADGAPATVEGAEPAR
jgi:hypothetical protein